MDEFASIAAGGIGGRMELLTQPVPIEYDRKVCHLKKSSTSAILSKEISNGNSNEDLISEIERLKEHYKPFLMDLTPKVETLKTRQYLTKFLVNGEKCVNIPEYEGMVKKMIHAYENSTK